MPSNLIAGEVFTFIRGSLAYLHHANGLWHPFSLTKRLNKHYGESEKSFVGSYFCGPSSFMVKQILDKNGIDNKVLKTNYIKFVNGDYLTDQVS